MSEKTNWVFTNLFISLYDEKNKQRFDELHTCLMNNLKSGVFDAIWIIAEVDDNGKVDYISKFNVAPYTVNVLPCTTRPTFRTFFNAVNNIDDMLKRERPNSSIGRHDNAINIGNPIGVQVQPEENVYIIANSDIYIEDLPILPNNNQCFALTRWEVGKNGAITFLNRKDSSDMWIFRSRIKSPSYADFHNLPGCDNRINWEIRNIGYEISNPSRTIKTYHLHNGAKSYDGSKRVNKPYLFLEPTI